jgi:hypothetical protein
MKCILCNKEFPDNISDYLLLTHFLEFHSEEVKETAQNIKTESKKQKINKSVNSNDSISKL